MVGADSTGGSLVLTASPFFCGICSLISTGGLWTDGVPTGSPGKEEATTAEAPTAAAFTAAASTAEASTAPTAVGVNVAAESGRCRGDAVASGCLAGSSGFVTAIPFSPWLALCVALSRPVWAGADTLLHPPTDEGVISTEAISSAASAGFGVASA